MTEIPPTPDVELDTEQLASLEDQVAQLKLGEPYATVLAGGQVFVRPTRGLPEAVIRLWDKHPGMMVPDSVGYRPEVRRISIRDL